MNRDDWPVGDFGIRPVTEDQDICTYCKQPRGAQHEKGCTIRQRTIVVKLTVEYVCEVPEDWDEQMIHFHFNEGTYCMDNEFLKLRRQLHVFEEQGGCFCSRTHAEYVREASDFDESMFHLSVADSRS